MAALPRPDDIRPQIEFLARRVQAADDAPRTVENAVLPLLHLDGKLVRQHASSVLLRIGDEFFLLSASHAFEPIGGFQVLVGSPAHEPIGHLAGDRFSFKRGPSGTHSDDPIDASVLHVQAGLSEAMLEVAITLDDLAPIGPSEPSAVVAAIGYFAKRSKSTRTGVYNRREWLPSAELRQDDYDSRDLDRTVHLAIGYEDMVLRENGWTSSPKPEGFSGGAMVRYVGTSVNPLVLPILSVRPLLAAITIERRKDRDGHFGTVIGTRVEAHLELIRRYLPETEGLEAWKPNQVERMSGPEDEPATRGEP